MDQFNLATRCAAAVPLPGGHPRGNMSQLNVTTGKHDPGVASTSASVMPAFSSSTNPASFFQCPVCLNYMLPSIMKCQRGYLVCNVCRTPVTRCSTCQNPLGKIRKPSMEKKASNVMFPYKYSAKDCMIPCKYSMNDCTFPCKYSTSGCTALLMYTKKPDHEGVCEFRPYSCPSLSDSCKWQGSLEQVMPHLTMSHSHIITLEGNDVVFLATNISLSGAVDWVMIQSCFGHHFVLILEKQEKYVGHQQFFAIVQLIGSREQAENFTYRLQLNGHQRRLTWKATPRSLHEGVSSAILNSDCLVFDISIAQLFTDNDNLRINVNISKA